MRGLTRSVAFERHRNRLVSTEYELCSFVPIQGSASPHEQWISLDGDDVTLRIDGNHPVDVGRLRQALSQPRQEAWSSVTASGGRFDGLHLWLAINLTRFGVLTASQDAAARGAVAHCWALGIPTALTDTSFAYLGLRPLVPDRSLCEFGVYGHGPDAEGLMDQTLQHIRSWDGSSLDARFEVHPGGTPQDQLPQADCVLTKQHTQLAISWPC